MSGSSRVLSSRRRALAMLGAGLLSLGTACAPKVQAERTPGFDLESAKTYAWLTDDLVLIQLGTDQPNVRTKENEQRIREAVDRELASRGFSKVEREQAEVLVAFSVGVSIRYRVEGGEATPGLPVTAGDPAEPRTKGTLNIYLLDPHQEREIWHGWTSKWLDKKDDPGTVIDTAVSKIMAVYPGPTL